VLNTVYILLFTHGVWQLKIKETESDNRKILKIQYARDVSVLNFHPTYFSSIAVDISILY